MTFHYHPQIDAVIRPDYERIERRHERPPLIIEPLSLQELNGTRFDRVTLSADALASQQQDLRGNLVRRSEGDSLATRNEVIGSFNNEPSSERMLSQKAKSAIREYLEVADAQRKFT
ncbi:hypothetical protein [Aurantivibrio plasticivorans]